MTLTVFTSQECGPCMTYKQEIAGLPDIEIVDVDDPANHERAIEAQAWQVPTSITSSGLRWTGVRSRAEVVAILGYTDAL